MGSDHSRDPCPWVCLSDFGGAFCMGVSTSLALTSQYKHAKTLRPSEVQCGMVLRVLGTMPPQIMANSLCLEIL